MKFKIHKKETIHSGFIDLERRTVEYEKFTGEMSGQLDREVVVKNDAIAALVYHTELRRFLLVKQFRAPLAESDRPWTRELVAGHIDAGEKAEQAAVREIEEEIGYRPSKVRKLCSFFTSPGFSNEQIILFACEVDNSMKTSEGGGLDEENEDILVETFAEAEIKEMISRNELRDAKTIIAFLHYFNEMK